ncbi:MAG TPA: hypothetical protein VFU37_04960 [Pyrinomonadaceae bacterium]|nr:hypothetical protein [Pyrinomonadaceae bacterium]
MVQQTDNTNAGKKKGVTKASSAATNQVTAQTGSQPPAASLTYTIKSEPKMPYQGELVKFNLTPAGQTHYAFEFAFDDGELDAEKKSTKPNELHIEYRFKNSGQHVVTARPTVSGAVLQTGPTVQALTLNVRKIPLVVCENSVDSNPNLHFFVGQELSFATIDLKDPALTYRFVFDEAHADASTRESLPGSIQSSGNEPLKAATFVYASKDPRKKVHAEILWTDPETQLARSDTQTIRIDPLPRDPVDLTFAPARPEVNQEITLTGSLKPVLLESSCSFKENLQYRFEFAGHTLREWSSEQTVKVPPTLYNAAGTYKAKVQARLSSEMQPIEMEVDIPIAMIPKPRPPVVCIPCWIIGGVIVLVCGILFPYLVYKLIVPQPPPQPIPTPPPSVSPPNPSVPPHPTLIFNSGEQTASDKAPQLRVDVEIRVNAQVTRSEPQLTLNDGRLIKFVRRQHG